VTLFRESTIAGTVVKVLHEFASVRYVVDCKMNPTAFAGQERTNSRPLALEFKMEDRSQHSAQLAFLPR
jgi:hypothetical protein